MKYIFSLCFLTLYASVLLSQNADFKGIKYLDVIKLNDKSVYQGKIVLINDNVVILENIGGYKIELQRKDIKNIQQVCLNCNTLNDKIAEKLNEDYSISVNKNGAIEIESKDKEPAFKGFYHLLSVGFITSDKTLPGGNVNWTSGYFIRPRIGLGAGLGVQSFGDYTDLTSSQNKQIIMTPVFADVRVYLKESNRTPFLSLAGGYSFPQFNTYAKGGYYFFPSVGTQLLKGKGTNFTLNFGFLVQKIAYNFGESNYDYQIINRDIILRRWALQVGMKF
jgi:hypothetical protein